MPRSLEQLAAYRFPLDNKGGAATRATGGAVTSRTSYSSEGPSLDYPGGYIVVFGVPIVMLGALFGIGAGASVVDKNITMHPGAVARTLRPRTAHHLVRVILVSDSCAVRARCAASSYQPTFS